MPFYSHIADDGRRRLPAQQHCKQAAQYAAQSLEAVGLSNTAYLAGLLHDAGKFKQEFQEYLLNATVNHQPVRRGSVNHTFIGARLALDLWHNDSMDGRAIASELLAFSVGSHHGQFDCVDEKRKSGFAQRQERQNIGYEESVENFLEQCAGTEELNARFSLAAEEITANIEKIVSLHQPEKEPDHGEIYFYVGLLSRLLLSAVIEGDRRSTAEFMRGTVFPAWPKDMRPIWEACLERVERKLNGLPSKEPIQRARRVISDRCAVFAQEPGGIYRLNVPTGGGKTLSSLRFALNHAKQQKKSRIIFTVPLLSILDQNAEIIRDYIGDDSLILEHHSNLVRESCSEEELDRLELLCETWESPLIITTLVQLMNTLFSGKTSAIRRFHSLANSVIVLDEIQTVPSNMLTLFNLAVNFLAEICGATVVLCSATQPCLEAVTHPLCCTPRDMVPWDPELWAVFQRTQIRDRGCCRLLELSELVQEDLRDVNSLLVVCNKRQEAADLFSALSGEDIACFHLSASMCTADRRDTLARLKAALKNSEQQKVVCISTQVIEAGVDISFQRVIRLAAGMDHVIQAAGRCNRNADQDEPALVDIVQCVDERLMHLEDIRRGQKATIALLNAFEKAPEQFQNDLSGREAIQFYYHQLFQSMDAGYQDDVVQEYGSLFELLSNNPCYADGTCAATERYFLRQAFRLAGRLFQVFDQDTTDVLVPYGRGRELRETLLELAKKPYELDYGKLQAILQEAKPYTVSLYNYQYEKLQQQEALTPLFGGSMIVLTDGFYHDHTGLQVKIEIPVL